MSSTTLASLPVLLFLCASSLLILYFLGLTIYNVYFHPLSSYPGPKIAAATPFWWVWHSIQGDLSFHILALHEKYGEIVRVAPDELNFTNPQAWKDIYGHRQGIPENKKDPREEIFDSQTHKSLVFSDKEKHSYLRRLLSNAFSDKAMKTQETVLQRYSDKLIQRLHERCGMGSGTEDLVAWYNFTTFDLIGHLAFDESFDCLESNSYHPWVRMIFTTFRYVTIVRSMKRLSPFWKLLYNPMPKIFSQSRMDTMQMTREKVHRRKQRSPEYIDFLTHLLEAEAKGTLDIEDVYVNSDLLIVAGSETTATLLAGATYYILKHREVLERLVKEVRSSFYSAEDITIAAVNKLTFMLVCLDESFRLFPPAATAHERVLPAQGATICGRWIPGGTSCGISQYAAFRASRNWKYPLEFIPDRWLDHRDTTFASDKRDALQPFSHGPRNCIGRNLAYIEMRLIMAKLLYNFDLELTEECQDWVDKQMIWTTWDKPPLMVRLKPVVK